MMKAYLAIKYHEDHQNRELIQSISTTLAQNGFETLCIARDVEAWGQIHLPPAELMQRSFAEIEDSDLVVVELTEKGVGVGIEAGYAYAKGIPLVAIARKGADISKTLQGISQQVFWYADFDGLNQFLHQIKAEQVAAAWTSSQSGVEFLNNAGKL